MWNEYAESDDNIAGTVDEALRVVCLAIKETDQDIPDATFVEKLKATVPPNQVKGVVSSLSYLRDRVGVPRDLPLAAGRYLRAYLNWAIDTLN